MSLSSGTKEMQQSKQISSSSEKQDDECDYLDPWSDEWIADVCSSSEEDEPLLFKCTKCGYSESVPRWVVGEFAEIDYENGKSGTKASMRCPKCNGKMIRIK